MRLPSDRSGGFDVVTGRSTAARATRGRGSASGDQAGSAATRNIMTRVPALSSFELELHFGPIAFGEGTSQQVRRRLDELEARRPLVVGTPAAERRYRDVVAPLGDLDVAHFFGAAPHCPEPVVERCKKIYREAGCDSVVAIGGGSTLGLGKILAAEHGARFVALPTTYSGSEMTPLYGRKIGSEKRVARDSRCRPQFVIYDSSLTVSLPTRVAVATGMNSVAHAIEALYPQQPNPLATALAEQALAAHRYGLREIARGSSSTEALRAALYGGFLGGVLVAMCGIALHHRLCHVLGGLFDLPHSETNSAVLPHAVAYNLPAIPAARAVIERVFEHHNAAAALFDFATEIGAPRSLRELGMPEQGIDAAVTAMLAHGGWNPGPIERAPLERLVRAAYWGTRPT
jgi:alcohol dehydrogenase class IV